MVRLTEQFQRRTERHARGLLIVVAPRRIEPERHEHRGVGQRGGVGPSSSAVTAAAPSVGQSRRR